MGNENYLTFWAQTAVNTGMNSIWRSVTAGVSQEPILCSAMLNTFINDLDGMVPKYSFSKFPGTTKLRVVIDTPNRKVAMQRDLARGKKWTNRNLMKFSSEMQKMHSSAIRKQPHAPVQSRDKLYEK